MKKVRPTYTCKICQREISYRDQDRIDAFIQRGNVCGYCFCEERSLSSEELKSGERYISPYTTESGKDSYRVKFDKHRRSISRSFKSLEDAITYRDQIIDFYKQNLRMPNDSELESLFGLRFYCRKHRRSNDLTNDLKNIRYYQKIDRYFVCIIRDRVRFNTSFATLEEAKFARKLVLDEYDASGRMLTVGEVRARMKECDRSK